MAYSGFLKLARWIVRFGVPVVPGYSGEKFSRIAGWPQLATTSDEQLVAWDDENSYFNVIAVAKFGCVCIIDIDDLRVLDRLPRPLPDTLKVKSPSGGIHVYFLATNESNALGNANVLRIGDYIVPDSKAKATCLLELKVNDCSVAAPGALNSSGISYKPVEPIPPALLPIPSWLVNWIAEHREVPRIGGIKGRTLHPDFEPEDWFDWYKKKGAFTVGDPINRGAFDLYVPTNGCIYRGDFHEHSKLTGFKVYKDGGFGYTCFATSCPGHEASISDIMGYLEEEGYEPYPYGIYEDEDDEVFLEGVDIVGDETDANEDTIESISSVVLGPEVEVAAEPEGTAAVPEAMASPEVVPTNEVPTAPESVAPEIPVESSEEVERRPSDELDLVEQLLAVIFSARAELAMDFALYRRRLWWIIENKAWMKPHILVLKTLLSFELSQKTLPTRTSLLRECKEFGVLSIIDAIPQVEDDLTLDYVCQKLIAQAQFLDEQRTARKFSELVMKDHSPEGLSKARGYVKERWSAGIAGEGRMTRGSLSERSDGIYERFRRLVEIDTENPAATNRLSFRTGFSNIDDAIIAEEERSFAVIAPASNYKTSVMLTTAYNLAQQGKSVLYVTGEHAVELLEDRVAMLHGHFFRHLFTIPSYKVWRDRKATKQDLANLKVVLDDLHLMRLLPGTVNIKHVSEFNNDLDSIRQWMEANHAKYQFDVLMIDPFDTLLLNVDSNSKFFKGNELIQKLFDLKTSYMGGQGLIVVTSFQMKKGTKAEIEELQRDPHSSLADFEDKLDASNITLYSGVLEKFDMLWGVAMRNKSGTQGCLTCARTRHSEAFESFWFKVDPESHYLYQAQKAAPVAVEMMQIDTDVEDYV